MIAATCSVAGNVLTVDLTTITYTLGQGVTINVKNFLNLPTIAKDYVLDINIKSSGGTMIESYTQRITFTPTVLAAMNLYSMPKERDITGIFILDFTIPFIVPLSGTPALVTDPTSEIRIYLEPIGTTFIPKDLGYGVTVPTSIPCRGTKGFSSILGGFMTCVVYPGITPYIKVTNYQALAASTPVTIEFGKFLNPNGDFTCSISVLKNI